MKERPILFSPPMVQAILAGRKTQTRRVIKQGIVELSDSIRVGHFEKAKFYANYNHFQKGILKDFPCPYGFPGDRLWVRESYYKNIFDSSLCYAEDMRPEHETFWKKKPSIYMPRAASRLLLGITDIQPQRLHDITEEDAIAEGVEYKDGRWRNYMVSEEAGFASEHSLFSAVASFNSLWQRLNGRESLADNPWVWRLTVPRIE